MAAEEGRKHLWPCSYLPRSLQAPEAHLPLFGPTCQSEPRKRCNRKKSGAHLPAGGEQQRGKRPHPASLHKSLHACHNATGPCMPAKNECCCCSCAEPKQTWAACSTKQWSVGSGSMLAGALRTCCTIWAFSASGKMFDACQVGLPARFCCSLHAGQIHTIRARRAGDHICLPPSLEASCPRQEECKQDGSEVAAGSACLARAARQVQQPGGRVCWKKERAWGIGTLEGRAGQRN